MKIIPYKTACANYLPDDEHMMFETAEGAKNSIKALILKKCAFC